MANVNDIEEQKRYIFLEMSEEEFEQIETRFFEDSDYFVDVMTLENDLIDKYAAGLLKGDDLARFERALPKAPERREKIATAQAMQTLIAEERPREVPITVAPGLWERISNFFTFKGVQMAGAALGIALVCLSGYLVIKNRQMDQQLAQVREEQKQALAQQQKELQEQISELKRQQQESQDVNNELNIKLEEAEERLRKLQDLKPTPEPTVGLQSPILAFTVNLAGRGNSPRPPSVRSITTRDGKQLALVTVYLPEGAWTKYEVMTDKVTVKSDSLAPGRKSIVLTLPGKDTDFTVNVYNAAGEGTTVGTYKLGTKKVR